MANYIKTPNNRKPRALVSAYIERDLIEKIDKLAKSRTAGKRAPMAGILLERAIKSFESESAMSS